MMQFTLMHDGSNQGWHAAYLAFHLAVRLGAPLHVLLLDSAINHDMLDQRAAQVEVGGRAAGLTIRTHLVDDFSLPVAAENAAHSDGLIVPRQLVNDKLQLDRLLQASSGPVWVVSQESDMSQIAVLVKNSASDLSLVDYTVTLSNRLQTALIGLATNNTISSLPDDYPSVVWRQLSDFTPAQITSTLNLHAISLVFLPKSCLSLVDELPVNYAVYPA